MTIQNVLDWLQEAEDNNCWQVSTQSVKRHLEEVQKQQLILYGVTQQSEQLPTLKDISKLEIGETIFEDEKIKIKKR